MAKAAKSVGFIATIDCLAVPQIPEGPEWTYEIKLDGFRVEAVKQHGKVTLYSRRGNILNTKFPYIATALKELPDETIRVNRSCYPSVFLIFHEQLMRRPRRRRWLLRGGNVDLGNERDTAQDEG
jgi:ATP dependent DNA ligase domain